MSVRFDQVQLGDLVSARVAGVGERTGEVTDRDPAERQLRLRVIGNWPDEPRAHWVPVRALTAHWRKVRR